MTRILTMGGISIATALVVGAIMVFPTELAEAANPVVSMLLAGTGQRVSITTDISSPGSGGLGVIVLLDTTGSGSLSDVHVAATLPCAGPGSAPAVSIVAGVAGVTIPPGIPIISTGAQNTGFPGNVPGTCIFHGTISGAAAGTITDIVVLSPAVSLPPGSIVTVTGTYA